MLFVYECTGNIIADFKKFYDTQLSEQDKKKIFIPTYDCMKRYQGSWHVEQKPLFTNCFFIECSDKEELKTTLSRQHCSDSLAEYYDMDQVIAAVLDKCEKELGE